MRFSNISSGSKTNNKDSKTSSTIKRVDNERKAQKVLIIMFIIFNTNAYDNDFKDQEAAHGVATFSWDNESPTTSPVDLKYNPDLFANQLAC